MNTRVLTIYLSASLIIGCQPASEKKIKASPTLCVQSKVTLEGIDQLGLPIIRTEIGNSELEISTDNEEAQKWFNQGLNLLHGFWHFEAYRAFQKVIQLDPNCAMGYWGIEMSQPGFSGEEIVWKEAMTKALSLSKKATPLEVALINCGNLLLTYGLQKETIQSFIKLAENFPNNPEAQAFAAIMLRQGGEKEYFLKAKALLEKALVDFPNHTALVHYYTHVIESTPEFLQVEKTVNKMAQIGNQSPHLVHMPGHISFLKGDYEGAVNAFRKAKSLDEVYHKKEGVPYLTNQNYLHNIHYLAVALAENGQFEEALAAANKYALINLKSAIPNKASEYLVHFEGLILPAFVQMRFRNWQKASDYLQTRIYNLDKPLPSQLVKSYFQGINAFCRGMHEIESGNVVMAQKQLDEMQTYMAAFNEQGLLKSGQGDFVLINEVYDVLMISSLELKGWLINQDLKSEFNVQPFREALQLEENMGYGEPPKLIYPVLKVWVSFFKKEETTEVLKF
jgi:tetratricopeptide (TPR) repeat protein